MQNLPLISKFHYAFSIWLVFLITGCLGCFASSKWQILTQKDTLHSSEIISIFFTNPQHGWSLTPFQLLETYDGGKTWMIRLENNKGERAFYSFEFVNPMKGFIVGVQQTRQGRVTLILGTEDGGKSWQENPFKISSSNIKSTLQLNSVSFCNTHVGWAVGSNLIIHTNDGGQTWETQRNDNNEENLLSVACVSSDRAWVVGQNGIVLQTKDGGKSWEPKNIGTKDSLVRVRFLNGEGWILGGANGKSTLFRTRDNGVRWEHLQTNTSESLFDININSQQGWIVGAKGTILHTSNGGQTWLQERSPTDNDLFSLFFLNPQHGWIGGSQRILLRLSKEAQ